MVVEMDNHNELKGVFEFFDNGWWNDLPYNYLNSCYESL